VSAAVRDATADVRVVATGIDHPEAVAWRPDRIYRLSPSGALEVYLDDYTAEFMSTPTNLAFGGDDMRTLYPASLAGWSVSAVECEVAGHVPLRPG
jgi:hypothetical protein